MKSTQGEGVDEVVDEQKHLLVKNAAVDLEARDSSTERSELGNKWFNVSNIC